MTDKKPKQKGLFRRAFNEMWWPEETYGSAMILLYYRFVVLAVIGGFVGAVVGVVNCIGGLE